jgi:hypothetical protein
VRHSHATPAPLHMPRMPVEVQGPAILGMS